VRSFRDGRYYTVPKKEATTFTREQAAKQESAPSVVAALEFINDNKLPPNWDRDAIFGLSASSSEYEQEYESDSSDDEPTEEKDHFVAQLYKFMDDRGTPLNKGPSITNRDVDLYRLFRAVQKLGGYNRVTSQNQWKSIALRLGFSPATASITNLVKQAYKKFLHSFEEFNRKLGCTMVAHPRANRIKGRSLLRANSVASPKAIEQHKEKEKEKSSSAEAESETTESESSPPPPPPPPSSSAKTKRKMSSSSGKVKALVDKFEGSEKEVVKQKPPSSQKDSHHPPTPSHLSGRPEAISKAEKLKRLERAEKQMQQDEAKKEKAAAAASLATPTMKKMGADDKRGRSGSKKTPQSDDQSQKKPPPPPDMPSSSSKKDSSELKESVEKDVPIEIGDKLKVFYHEQKHTYEAKVIDIAEQNGPLFYVHYTGWNTR
jgi:Ras-related protein Rab-1A